MKKAALFIGLILLQLNLSAQGVEFTNLNTWEQIKLKAQKENKYIFLDFYATWCAPCKVMDETVYSQQTIGEIMNPKFISVKLQMDKTPADTKDQQRWYNQVALFKKEFNLNSMPTQVFFSPEGKPIRKEIGYKDRITFLRAILAIDNPENNYYDQILKFEKAELPYQQYPNLIKNAKNLNDEEIAKRVASKYIENYVMKLPDSSIYNQTNLELMGAYLGKTTGSSYNFFVKNSVKINEKLGKNSAEYAIRKAIQDDCIPDGSKWQKSPPNWESLEKSITKKFGLLGFEAVNSKKLAYYMSIKDWTKFGEAYHSYFKTALQRPEYNINNISFSLFENVHDQNILKFACDTVMKYAIEEWYQTDAAAYDTYANLLYKTQRTVEAIQWEEKALKIANGTADEAEIRENLNKMKTGVPTWLVAVNNNK